MSAPDIQVTTKNSGVAKQIIASGIVSISSLMGGMGQGWTSPMTLKLQSDDSPVGPMTTGEIANLASLPTYLSLVAIFGVVYITNNFGRKPALIVTAIPTCIGYVIMVFASNNIMLYIGKTLSSMGAVGISQMYVSETTHESIRGVLMAVCTLQINVGILLSYILGKYLNFQWFNAVFAVVPAVFAVLALLLPETPYYLVSKSRESDAMKSLLWLRGGNSQLAEDELHQIKHPNSETVEERLTFSQEFKTRASRIAALISILGFLFQGFSGIYAVINFAGLIFEQAGSPLEAQDSAILTAVINLIASCFNLVLIDRFGRKPLLYISFIGSGISLTVLTVFLYAQQHYSIDEGPFGWIPIGSLGTFIFCYGIGLASVPGVLLNEMTPTSIKAALGTGIGVFSLLVVLLIVQTFPVINDHIGLWFSFGMPAIFNILGIFFTMFIVRETKGKSLTEISNELNNK